MPLRLLTLGAPLELIGPDGTPRKLTNSKHLVLLAYLVLEPGSYSREWLTRFIWSSGEPGSLNDALSALRGLVGEGAFPPRVRDITLPPGIIETDANDFQQVAATPEHTDAFDQALRLYRGPFLEDFNARGASTRLIAWVERRRVEFERQFLERVEEECERLATEGNWRGIDEVVAAVGKRVPVWPQSDEWLQTAAALRKQSGAKPSGVAIAATAADNASVGERLEREPYPATVRPRRGRHSLIIGSAVALAAFVFLFLHGPYDRQLPPVAADSAQAPVCRAGAARAQLVEEVFHYGVRVRAGRPFAKRWTLQNDGDCTWSPTFRLHFVSAAGGAQLSATMMDIPLKRPVPPGDTAAFVLQMRAPTRPGWYEEVWQLRDDDDQPVIVGDKPHVAAAIKVPLPHYPTCGPGQGSSILLVKKYPDGTPQRPEEAIRYSWTLKNDGECAWGSGAVLRFEAATADRMSRVDSVVATRSVEPDETYTFLVGMQTAARPGVYQESWQLRGSAGTPIPIDRARTTGVSLRVLAPDVPVTTAPLCPPGAAQVRFVDENWPDSSRVHPGQEFVKRWTVTNMGRCAWPANYQLAYTSNTIGQLARSRNPRPLAEIVPPDAAYTFEVPMRAPINPGYYREDWRFVDNRGNLIMIGTSPYLAALIVVGTEGG